MFSRQFWTLTTERMIKTFAQTLASVLVAGGAGLFSAGWAAALSTAGMAAVVSVLTSVGSLKIGPTNSPSMVATEPVPTTPPPVTLPQPAPSAPVTQLPSAPTAPAAEAEAAPEAEAA